MKKQVLTVFMAGILTASMSMTALAGWEQEGNNWKYNDNGTYAANGWYWIDGNNDGIAESYYFDNTGILARDTTVEGYTVNTDGAWVVNGEIQTRTDVGVVQTKSVAVNNGNAATGGVNHSAGYDPAHPLAGKIDEWNLRITNTGLIGGFNICNESFQALLTGQMDKYYMAPAGYSTNPVTGSQVYISQQDYDEGVMIENALYQWFCNWLNGMDFENMSEMDRAREIQKVMSQIKFQWSSNTTRYTYYDTLINKKGSCAECAMTAGALAKALGLKASISGTGEHMVYYIQVDGKAYFGQNETLNLNSPTPDNVYFQ